MPRKTFTATLPDGSVAKRTSQSRDYTHVVVIEPATQEARTAAFNRHADSLEAKAQVLEQAAERGVVTVRDRGFSRGRAQSADDYFHSHEVVLQGAREKTPKGMAYNLVSSHANHRGEIETWARFARGIEPLRETSADYKGEMQYAYDGRLMLIAKAREEAANLRAMAAETREKGLQPDLDGYQVPRWSSRRDLAEKALTEFSYATEFYGRTLTVQAVD